MTDTPTQTPVTEMSFEQAMAELEQVLGQLERGDVEGAEHLVLKGGLETLTRERPLLLMEIHSVVCMLSVLELLHPLGYSARLLHEDRPGRCFIMAS